jgi:hypothetical protein
VEADLTFAQEARLTLDINMSDKSQSDQEGQVGSVKNDWIWLETA